MQYADKNYAESLSKLTMGELKKKLKSERESERKVRSEVKIAQLKLARIRFQKATIEERIEVRTKYEF